MIEEHYKHKEEERLKENLESFESTLKSIKSKTKILESQTRFLKDFNTRLEILLKCFEAYSFEEAEDSIANKNIATNNKASSITASKNSVVATRLGEDKDNVVNSSEDEKQNNKKVKTMPDNSSTAAKANPMEVIETVFEKRPAAKNLAMTLFEIIQANEPISLDNLVKSIKTSKYKAIEIVNVLIKEKVILKSFDRGFVYRINREY
ncbi:uncharacterized protein VICG_00325 [Vittaforma corneae ATCC 50505]|uniref:Uncharacterized protein n=1 Tax=Vittaforma corneae (strain ATCC 50505) TaxID=993615 RepID=L2GNW3_VITCO|nr:uncharacterized protein VICG_00325 [Vittaforma corneae ATCC 50505]ELA42573.1 hypothetical protein VICG_00325 [Vittaforma corneae ATCC 50505]